MVDAEASLAAVRLAWGTVVTASMDHVQFTRPFVLGTRPNSGLCNRDR